MNTAVVDARRDLRVEQGLRTQRRVLDAAVTCLVRHGYTGATMSRIAEVAGVSRGALMHHFPTREELVAAAVEHLALRRASELADQERDLPSGSGRVEAALDLLWSSFSGDLFHATLELWTASRVDQDLRARVDSAERRLAGELHLLFARLLGESSACHADFEQRVQFALGTMRGLAVLDAFHEDARGRAQRWLFARTQLIEMFTGDAR